MRIWALDGPVVWLAGKLIKLRASLWFTYRFVLIGQRREGEGATPSNCESIPKMKILLVGVSTKKMNQKVKLIRRGVSLLTVSNFLVHKIRRSLSSVG